MLRITASESTAAAKHYFGQSLRRGDYYLKGQEIAGCWGGTGARDLGLAEKVKEEDFIKLLDNHRPDGERLTARTTLNRRPGYDFTFDVPKSVSLTLMLTGDDRIVEAMRNAVMETMREIEKQMHARVRKRGAFEDRQTGNMVWADFTHFTSRPVPFASDIEREILKAIPWLGQFRDKDGKLNIPDPHLHMHVYAINATYDAVERMWKAGEFMRIKRDAVYHQAAYHVRLAGELQKLGYGIEPTAKAFEIAGVPRELLPFFSRRTKEVEEIAAKLGITDPDAKAALGAKTRRRKNPELNLGQLKALWRGLVRKNDGKELEAVATMARRQKGVLARDNMERAHEGVRYALGRELERVSVVSEKRLLAAALTNAVGHVKVETVHKALAATPNIHGEDINGERHLTTEEVIKEESEMLALVRHGRGRVPPIVEGEYFFRNALFRMHPEETKEQREAVKLVLGSQDWVVGVIGRAGTGKTTLLKEVAEGVKAAGRRLIVCAPTAEASRGVLREEGFADADTLKRLLSDPGAQEKLSGAVLWIDEAGMVGNRDMLAALKMAKEAGVARVVLGGDPTQIRSVPRGDALRFLEEHAGLSVARLKNIWRQKAPEMKAAIEALSEGEVGHAFELLEKQGAIVEESPKEAHRLMAENYAQTIRQRGPHGREKTILMAAPTHAECESITTAVRSLLRRTGRLGQDERAFDRTVNLNWTELERANAAEYEPGLVVQFKQRRCLFERGERVLVESVNARSGKVLVRNNLGTVSELPLAEAKHFQVYRHEKLKVSVGECLRITENGNEGGYRLNNGALVKVSGFTPLGDIELANGRVIGRSFGHISHGYASTIDSVQAKTVDVVLVGISQDSFGATDMRRFYVALSRAREQARVFTDDRNGLLKAAQRDTPRRSAIELLGAERHERIVRDIRQREAQRHLDATREHALWVARERERQHRHLMANRTMGMEMACA